MTQLDKAVYAAAWRTSAFGVRAEVFRILKVWLEYGVRPEDRALIRLYTTEPDTLPRLSFYA